MDAWVLCGNAHRTGVEVTCTHHNTAIEALDTELGRIIASITNGLDNTDEFVFQKAIFSKKGTRR